MTIILNLSPETEARLLQQAASTGKRPDELALHVLEEKLATDPAVPQVQTPQQWVADFRRWAESHRRLPIEADDSRESIYAGRGE